MGLDMYLYAKKYISSYSTAVGTEIEKLFPEFSKLEKFRSRNDNNSIVKYITIEVGYWRKSNAIHRWFVKNVQNGIDDCQNYDVSRKILEQLRSDCKKVLDEPEMARKILPTVSGCFFGSTEYDEIYLGDLEYTVGIIDDALSLGEVWMFEYNSSW